MLNLRPHHRIQIPDILAVIAVLLLLVSSAASINTDQNTLAAGQEATISVNAEAAANDGADSVTMKKPRGLNLGLLLFRR